MLVYSLSMESSKRLAHDVIDTSAAHVGFVHYVTDFVTVAALKEMFSLLSNVDWCFFFVVVVFI